MPAYDIPKLARNKYNAVKDNSANNVVTTSQLMTSFGAGNSSGGGIGITHNTFQTQAQVESAIEKASYNDKISTYTYLQTYYVASADLKTINGYSLVGEGDIEVSGDGIVDLSAYATKTYVADYVYTYAPTADMSAYATKVYVAEYVYAYAPEPDLSSYATKTYVADYVDTYGGNVDLSAYATKTYVADYVTTYAPEPDLSSYVTKVELDAAGYACVYECTYSQYNSIATKDNNTIYIITDEDPISLMGYATKSYVNERCAEVQAASYAYTSSKVENAMTYNEVNTLIRDIISYMKSTGELIDSAGVDQKISDSRV